MLLWEAISDFYRQQFPVLVLSMPLMLVPFILLERYRPVGKPPRWRDYGFNIGVNLSTLAVAAPAGIMAAHGSEALRSVAPWPVIDFTFSDVGLGIPSIDPIVRITVMIFLPLLLHDIWFYWSHRLEHRVSWLWRFHRLHHSDACMNTSTFARDHIMQSVWRAFFSFFTLGLFVDIELKQAEQAALWSSLFLVLLSQFYHSALRVRLPWLDGVLVTPQVHRIHHSTDPAHYNRNFADVFPFFDRLFGTYHRPRPDEFPPTGLTDGTPVPTQWWKAQLEPFQNLFQPVAPALSEHPKE